MDTFWTHFGHILDTFWTHYAHMPVGCNAYLPRAQSLDTEIKYILVLQTAASNITIGHVLLYNKWRMSVLIRGDPLFQWF